MTSGLKTSEGDSRKEAEQPPALNIKLIRIDLLWIRYLIR